MAAIKFLNILCIFLLTIPSMFLLVSRSQYTRQNTANVQPVGQSSGWNMIFHDEFNGNKLDLSKWTPNWLGESDTSITKPVDDSETECVVPNAIKVAKGNLYITAIAKSCTVKGTTYLYQSGLIESNAKFNFTYGYMEARIWQPYGTGMWPGFWSDGQNWPQDGEIDVLEGDGTGNSSYHYHYGGWNLITDVPLWINLSLLISYIILSGWLLLRFCRRNRLRSIVSCIVLYLMLLLLPVTIFKFAGCDSECGPGGSVVISGATTGWHTYAADWEPGIITWYYDGQEVWQWNSNVSSSPMYLIVNLGLSSNQSAVPATMKVDYVRVWQKCTTSCTVNSTMPSPTNISAPTIHISIMPKNSSTPTSNSPGWQVCIDRKRILWEEGSSIA